MHQKSFKLMWMESVNMLTAAQHFEEVDGVGQYTTEVLQTDVDTYEDGFILDSYFLSLKSPG
jgi:hypothetical protein